MKIVTSDTVYIQKRDVPYILECSDKIPLSLLDKLNSVEVDYTNKEDYISFDIPHEMYFIKQTDWLINYSDVVNLDIEKLERLVKSLLLEKDVVQIKDDETEGLEKKDALEWQIKVLEHKIETITTIIEYKKNNKRIPLPEDLGDQNRPNDGVHPKSFVKTIKRS